MDRIMLAANEFKAEIIKILEKEKYIVLATCAEKHITARTVSYVNNGLDILFQTDKRFMKVGQMLQNPQVALCVGNLQVEGVTEFLGHPSESVNIEFCKLYKQKHPHSFDLYTGIKYEVVFRVKPSLFTLWKYVNEKPCREYLDLKNGIAYRDYYDMENTMKVDNNE